MKLISKNIAPYRVEVFQGYDHDELKKLWTEIQENNQDTPFFLTWDWISCWIETFFPEFILVKADIDGQCITAGLFTRSHQTRRNIINSKQIRLHQMGDPLQDQIWMEYNDFICIDGHRETAVNACLKALEEDHHWDEIVLSMMTAPRALEVLKTNHLAVLDFYRPCYTTDLAKVTKNSKTYLEALTGNTRYQIRRSIRLYENKYGPMSLNVAESTPQALEYFTEIEPYHIARWPDSGYKNQLFKDFHRNLIQSTFHQNVVHLLKVTAGEQVIAIMYYHQVGTVIYFYLHGLRYENDKKLKPGLVAHSLATQYFMDKGMSKYDYMGGYSQYKEQLAELSAQLVTVVIQRPRPRFKLEKTARAIKNRIFPGTQ